MRNFPNSFGLFIKIKNHLNQIYLKISWIYDMEDFF